MTPSAHVFPPRRPIFFPVVIATVFLTIIGMSAGYVLGERHRKAGDNQSNQSQQQQTSATATQPSSAPTSTGPACPPEASEKAVEAARPPELTQVMKIVTHKGTTVWICQDPKGDLYYQSKTGGVSSALIQGKNGLFLLNVQKTGTNQYEATAPNDGNRFDVSRTHLHVTFKNGTEQDDAVDKVE